MEKPSPGQQKTLDAFIKTAQYLASLTTHQDVWSEVGKVLVNFFGADLVAFGERRADGEIIGHHWAFSDQVSSQRNLAPEAKEAVAEVLESGFLTSRLILTPDPLSVAFLPITQESQVTAVILVGHGISRPLPRELLNVYLAVAGLVGTTATRLTSETELRQHRQHLEKLVKERTAELGVAKERAEAADRLKSVFLASMSHELRTPLNSIIGFTGVILQGMSGEVNERQREQLTVVKKNANHLLSLINDILDISKIEAGKVELSLEEFSLDDVAGEVVETLSPTANQKGLELLTEVPEGITLSSDRRRVKQVLVNLGSNAVKFTNRGSVKIAARVLGDDNLEVRVIDTGIGIKEEDMDKLFQPFQQIDVSLTKEYQGTGLGLHLARRLAALLGGDISAKSEYGTGSEFTFTLPLQYREEQK